MPRGVLPPWSSAVLGPGDRVDIGLRLDLTGCNFRDDIGLGIEAGAHEIHNRRRHDDGVCLIKREEGAIRTLEACRECRP